MRDPLHISLIAPVVGARPRVPLSLSLSRPVRALRFSMTFRKPRSVKFDIKRATKSKAASASGRSGTMKSRPAVKPGCLIRLVTTRARDDQPK